TLVVVETVVCVLMTYFARRYLNILELLKVAVKPLIISILVGTVVFITFEVISIENDFLKIILKIILYGIVYLGLLIITKTVSKSEISMLRRR
uniref:polysaccharide biosynthesis C-terminal domain-containing protein n=1 Tax=uncultured Streptococcus sp. TaxID=83427 RepID=UPI0026021560